MGKVDSLQKNIGAGINVGSINDKIIFLWNDISNNNFNSL